MYQLCLGKVVPLLKNYTALNSKGFSWALSGVTTLPAAGTPSELSSVRRELGEVLFCLCSWLDPSSCILTPDIF